MRKQVAIDLERVQIAFEDRDGEGKWFLDTETGDAERVSEYDDDDELRDQIEVGFGDRFNRIPYQGSSAGHGDMEEFAGAVTDDRVRALLEVAIRGKGASTSTKLYRRLGDSRIHGRTPAVASIQEKGIQHSGFRSSGCASNHLQPRLACGLKWRGRRPFHRARRRRSRVPLNSATLGPCSFDASRLPLRST